MMERKSLEKRVEELEKEVQSLRHHIQNSYINKPLRYTCSHCRKFIKDEYKMIHLYGGYYCNKTCLDRRDIYIF